MKYSLKASHTAALWSMAAFFAHLSDSQGLSATTDFTTWFNITEFPNAQPENVTRYLSEAKEMAREDMYPHYEHRCITGQAYPVLSQNSQLPGFVTPTRPFDSLFFVGYSFVSSWAVDTGAGLVLIDTLNNPDEVEGVLLPGLASFGYNATDIRAVIIMHEHADHYGGARYLQENFDIPLYASDAAWDGMADDPIKPEGLEPPVRNVSLADGQQLTVGNTTFVVYLTPGHTQGTVSLFFPVSDHGVKHMVGFYGGGGIPAAADMKAEQIASFERFAGLAEDEHGADVLLSNHQTQDNALSNFDELRARRCDVLAGCDQGNPFVVGTDAYVRYLKTMALCVRVQAARNGQDLTV